jgi:EpsD family peptidyl-prolyl cis-trans isomerase
MKLVRGSALLALTLILLTACKIPGLGGRGQAPTGQVVAKVGDQEITLRQLRAELPPDLSSDPAAHKAAEQVALRNMVIRAVLAQAARDQGLDKTPDFALQKQKVLEGLLVQSLQQKIISKMPATTPEDAEAFVRAHSDMFAERKIFTVDQIMMRRPSDPAIFKDLEPLKTFDQIEALLNARKIPFGRNQGSLDAASMDPRVVDSILKLPPNEVFVMPISDRVTMNQIRSVRIEPFTGPAAVEFATKLLLRQRTGEAVQREFNDIAKKAAPSIHLNATYAAANLLGPVGSSGIPAADHPAAK